MSEQAEPGIKGQTSIATSVTVAINTLQLWDKNPRSIKSERFTELKDRLKRQGQIKPLLVAKDGKTVIGGNMRLRAMQELGVTEVWISQTNASTDKEIFDLALTDNEEFGYYEQEQLAELALDLGLTSLELVTYEVNLGTPITLGSLIDKFGPEDAEEDEAPEVDEVNPPVSKLGEIYQLGRHRLMCGSATDYGHVTELINGDTINLVCTDPPYGVAVVKDNKVGADFGIAQKGNYAEVIGDETTETAKQSWEIIKELGIEKSILWGGNYFTDFLPPSNTWIVWDKRGDSGIRNTFADCELAWSNDGSPARVYTQLWNGMIREGEHDARVHPTQKPTRMLGQVLKDFSDRDSIVLDVFGGSGSVLIAADEVDRICYMMELSPAYVDVIRKRYAKHIGEEDWEAVTPVINQEVTV